MHHVHTFNTTRLVIYIFFFNNYLKLNVYAKNLNIFALGVFLGFLSGLKLIRRTCGFESKVKENASTQDCFVRLVVVCINLTSTTNSLSHCWDWSQRVWSSSESPAEWSKPAIITQIYWLVGYQTCFQKCVKKSWNFFLKKKQNKKKNTI